MNCVCLLFIQEEHPDTDNVVQCVDIYSSISVSTSAPPPPSLFTVSPSSLALKMFVERRMQSTRCCLVLSRGTMAR